MWGGYGGMDTVRHKPVEMKKHHYAWRKIKGGGWLSGLGRILGKNRTKAAFMSCDTAVQPQCSDGKTVMAA